MNINLRPLQKIESEDIYQMFQEIPVEEDGFENPAHGLSREEFADFCRRHIEYSQGINLKPNHVPDTYYLFFVDDDAVGFCKLRHYLNDFLLNHGGHIGYGIRPSARGRKFGNQILAELLSFVREKGIERVLLTIRDYNYRSRKVCEFNGGKLDKIVTGQEFDECFYWIDLTDA